MNRHLSKTLRSLLHCVGVNTVRHCVHGREYRVPLECTSLRHLLGVTDVLHEGAFYQHVLAMVHPGDVVFDIGAHLGKYVVGLSGRVAPGGRIIAFEANPVTGRHLVQIVRLNGLSDVVTVVNNAVGAAPGHISLTLKGNGCDPGQSLLAFGNRLDVEVAMTTVDKYVTESGVVPDLIKIDVEGYELMVLEGARHTLSAHEPKLCCEIHPRQLSQLGHAPTDVERFLRALGYAAQEDTTHVHYPKDAQRPYDVIFTKVGGPLPRKGPEHRWP